MNYSPKRSIIIAYGREDSRRMRSQPVDSSSKRPLPCPRGEHDKLSSNNKRSGIAVRNEGRDPVS